MCPPDESTRGVGAVGVCLGLQRGQSEAMLRRLEREMDKGHLQVPVKDPPRPICQLQHELLSYRPAYSLSNTLHYAADSPDKCTPP